jgi:uncharacterized protein
MMTKLRYGFLVFLALAMAQPAGAAEPQVDPMDTKALYKKAVRGDAWSAYYLGYLYQEGKNGLKQSNISAMQFYRIAAEAGNLDAAVNLGNMYLKGATAAPNPAQAAAWFAAAAQKGHPVAEYSLALQYLEGKGVPQDSAKAAQFYLRAATHGTGSIRAAAQNGLANLYRDGNGVEQSDKDAIKWYSEAVKGGNAAAQRSLAELYKSGRAEGLMKDADMVSLYKSAAMKGDADAQYNIGAMYEKGKHGIEPDIGAAIKWYRKSALQGNADAQHALGKGYYDGNGLPQDYQQAFFWYTLAAKASQKQGYSEARDETALHLTPEQVAKTQAEVQTWEPTREMQDR